MTTDNEDFVWFVRLAAATDATAETTADVWNELLRQPRDTVESVLAITIGMLQSTLNHYDELDTFLALVLDDTANT